MLMHIRMQPYNTHKMLNACSSVVLTMFSRSFYGCLLACLPTWLYACMSMYVCVTSFIRFFSAIAPTNSYPLSFLAASALARSLVRSCSIATCPAFFHNISFFSSNTFPSSLFCAFAIALACNIKIGWTTEVNAKFTGMYERREKKWCIPTGETEKQSG